MLIAGVVRVADQKLRLLGVICLEPVLVPRLQVPLRQPRLEKLEPSWAAKDTELADDG